MSAAQRILSAEGNFVASKATSHRYDNHAYTPRLHSLAMS
jgi:hypothetical protein